MEFELKRGAALSAALHLTLAALLLLGLPARRLPEEPEETAVSMDFVGNDP